MPLSQDAKGGGSEGDGSLSPEFCSHCYVDGKFTLPDLSVSKMVERVQGKVKQVHMPGFLIKPLTKDIPKLKRWSSTL